MLSVYAGISTHFPKNYHILDENLPLETHCAHFKKVKNQYFFLTIYCYCVNMELTLAVLGLKVL